MAEDQRFSRYAEFVDLPEKDLQRARREAFAAGAEWGAKMAEESAFPPSHLEVSVKAREAYPIRARKPRTTHCADREFHMDGSDVVLNDVGRPSMSEHGWSSRLCPGCVAAVNDLCDNPYEEVDS